MITAPYSFHRRRPDLARPALEIHPSADLNDSRPEPRGDQLAGDHAEAGGVSQVYRRVGEVDFVEDVEEIELQSEFDPFVNRRRLAYRQIELPARRPAQHATPLPSVRRQLNRPEAL